MDKHVVGHAKFVFFGAGMGVSGQGTHPAVLALCSEAKPGGTWGIICGAEI